MATRKTSKKKPAAKAPKRTASGSSGSSGAKGSTPPAPGGERNLGGAPVKFDAAAREKFLTGIRSAAMSIKTAAAFAGVSDDTVSNHRKADPVFDAQVRVALDEFKAQSQVIIAHAGTKHWQARAWLLERRFPEEFGRQRLELSGPDGAPIPHRIEDALAAGKAIRADADTNHAIHVAIGDAVERAREIARRAREAVES